MKYLITAVLMLQIATASAASCDLCEDLGQTIEGRVADTPELPSAAVYVYSPSSETSTGQAFGSLSADGETPLTYKHPFRTASVTKPFVAATIFRLQEQGKLDVQDPIEGYLLDDLVALLAGGGYDAKEITISHLLTHTSGLFDVFFTDAFLAYTADLQAGGEQKMFTLTEQVRLAVEHGNAYGAPGEIYHYSDTGYILLGAIIEGLTGQNMAIAVRELLGLDELGLDNTWWEIFESRPETALPMVHQYMGTMDTQIIQPTFDLYGGGGLISTTQDLARFYYHLLKGDVFDRPKTLDLMLAAPASIPAPTALSPDEVTARYAHGISVRTYRGIELYTHSGFWGIVAGYSPTLDTSFAVAFQQQELAQTLIDEAVRIVIEHAAAAAD